MDLKPDNPEVHNNLGLILTQSGNMEEALAQYAKAVEIKGDVPAIRRNYADFLSRLGRYEEAAAQYKIVVEHDPNGDPSSHLAYGGLLLQLGRPLEAQQRFEKVLQLDPNGWPGRMPGAASTWPRRWRHRKNREPPLLPPKCFQR